MPSAGEYFRLRQICLVAADLEQASNDIRHIFGVREAYRDPHLAVYGVANVIFPFGLGFIEVVAPLSEETTAARFLRRGGDDPLYGGYMAIFNCSDARSRRRHIDSLGIRIAAESDAPEFFALQLHPRDCRAAMIEFDQTPGELELEGNYHPAGGTAWQRMVDTTLTLGINSIVLSSPEPQVLGRHWASILQRPFAADGDGGRIAVDMCDIVFAAEASDSREMLCQINVWVSDPARVAAQAARLGYAVNANSIVLCGVRFAWSAA